MSVVHIVVIVVVVLSIIGANWWREFDSRQRREGLTVLARRLGLEFSLESNPRLTKRFGFLDQIGVRDDGYALNVVSGTYLGHQVFAFDFHYTTSSSDSDSGRTTYHHYRSVLVLVLPGRSPKLRITPKGVFSKIAQAMGHTSIAFESADFSRAFCVCAADESFARSVCHTPLIDFLVSNADLSIEIGEDALALEFDSRLTPDRIEVELQRLVAVRSRLPESRFSFPATALLGSLDPSRLLELH